MSKSLGNTTKLLNTYIRNQQKNTAGRKPGKPDSKLQKPTANSKIRKP